MFDKPNVVLVDATALACTAAKEIQIPCVILSNFTWEFIYKNMHADLIREGIETEITNQKFVDMIERCTEDYCNASHYLQLPGYCDLPTGYDTEKVLTSPMMCRLAKCTREDMRNQYNIPMHALVVVFGFGGQSFQNYKMNADTLPAGGQKDWYCLVLGCGPDADFGSDYFIPVGRDIYVPDVLTGADVMLGKIGYGTVSECLSSHVPLVYVKRAGWSEERPLVQLMERYSSIVEMPRSNFEEGKWANYLQEAVALKGKLPIDRMKSELQYENAISKIQAMIEIEVVTATTTATTTDT